MIQKDISKNVKLNNKEADGNLLEKIGWKSPGENFVKIWLTEKSRATKILVASSNQSD